MIALVTILFYIGIFAAGVTLGRFLARWLIGSSDRER